MSLWNRKQLIFKWLKITFSNFIFILFYSKLWKFLRFILNFFNLIRCRKVIISLLYRNLTISNQWRFVCRIIVINHTKVKRSIKIKWLDLTCYSCINFCFYTYLSFKFWYFIFYLTEFLHFLSTATFPSRTNIISRLLITIGSFESLQMIKRSDMSLIINFTKTCWSSS